jgi:hypothetical protein
VKARLAALVFVLLFAPAAVCAQAAPAEQIGNVTFRPPDGWRRAEADGALLLVPPDLPGGQSCVLIILPGAELRGDFRAAFDEARAALGRGERVVSEGGVSAERNPNGFDMLSALALTEDRSGKRTFRFYLAAHPGARIELFVFAATSDELLRRYVPAFKQFVGSVSFANLQAPPGDAPAQARAARGPAGGTAAPGPDCAGCTSPPRAGSSSTSTRSSTTTWCGRSIPLLARRARLPRPAQRRRARRLRLRPRRAGRPGRPRRVQHRRWRDPVLLARRAAVAAVRLRWRAGAPADRGHELLPRRELRRAATRRGLRAGRASRRAASAVRIRSP